MRKKSKRRVDWVIKKAHWEGFQDGLVDSHTGLEYASTSGLYQYNGIRKIAYEAGFALAQKLIEEAVERRQNPPRFHASLWKYKIPGAIYAECYGEARIAS